LPDLVQTFAQQFHPDAPWFNLFEMSVYFGFVFVMAGMFK